MNIKNTIALSSDANQLSRSAKAINNIICQQITRWHFFYPKNHEIF